MVVVTYRVHEESWNRVQPMQSEVLQQLTRIGNQFGSYQTAFTILVPLKKM